MVERGDFTSAMGYYEQAARDEPTDERWIKLANAASRAGAPMKAFSALSRVHARRTDPQIEKRLEEERQRALRGAVGK